MMGTVSSETWGGERARLVGLWVSDDCREVTKLDWKLDKELSVSRAGKSVMLAERGSKHGSPGSPAWADREALSLYILDKFPTARSSPSYDRSESRANIFAICEVPLRRIEDSRPIADSSSAGM